MNHCNTLSGDFRTSSDNFVSLSLEIHLFFGRIMKEHSLFLQAGFLPPDTCLQKQADWYRRQFENFLWQVVKISNGMVSEAVLKSGELVTEFTEKAERKTSRLTGIPIDGRITQAEKRLQGDCGFQNNEEMRHCIRRLNERAIRLTSGLIQLKEELIRNVGDCLIFTTNYPLLIEHDLREAKLYRMMIIELNEAGCLSYDDMCSMEIFWNQIMMEHALFMRGLLDPSEEELIETANGFAEEYRQLLCEAKRNDCAAMEALTKETLGETSKYCDFKASGAKGITDCEISSIIMPLLADHVLREGNHYLRILESAGRK